MLADVNQKTDGVRGICSPYSDIVLLNITRIIPNEEVSRFYPVLRSLPLASNQITYCRTGFDSDGLMAAEIATKNDRYRWNSL